MKKRWIAVVLTALCGSAVLLGLPRLRGQTDAASAGYILAQIDKGEIVTTITSTGTIQPVATVSVGTQVSGIIDKIYVDFNDTVTRGQLIAELDRTLLLGALDEALAVRTRAQAQYDLAKAEYERNEPLFKKGFVAEQMITRLRATFLTQEATLQSAEATVRKAKINLQYATITSPIKGTVIQRNIEAGQTVAASFSAPTLFIIAEDLKRMQILASVDEADIGSIRKGQEVRFGVQAFPDKQYSGTVLQVRLQPTVTQNVVTYTVVIGAENSDNSLMPGMTATVDFIVEKAPDVFMVPNAALRFTPVHDSLKGKVRRTVRQGANGAGEHVHRDASQVSSGRKAGVQPSERHRPKSGTVWIAVPDSAPRPLVLRTGITDGKMTEVASHRGELAVGMMVITGVRSAPDKKVKSVSLLPTSPRPPGGGRH